MSWGCPGFVPHELIRRYITSTPVHFVNKQSVGRVAAASFKEAAKIGLLEIAHLPVSRDATRKYLSFQLPTKKLSKSVSMSFQYRTSLTACVFSQVGCAVGCTFCATGYLGFKRNLTGQIVDQIMTIQRESGKRISTSLHGAGRAALEHRGSNQIDSHSDWNR